MIDLIEYIKHYSNYFKEYTIDIPIYDEDYEFDIVLITSSKIKLQHLFKYEKIYRSNENSVENLLKQIIIDSDRVIISDSFVLGQRARNNRKLKGTTFSAPVGDFDETFKITGVSQNGITIQIAIEFDDFNNYDEISISTIVMSQLLSLKGLVNSKIEDDEIKRLVKEEQRIEKLNQKSNIYACQSEGSLMHRALSKKYALKKTRYTTKVYGKVYSFDIEGVGPQAVKLKKDFDVFDIYYSESESIEFKIKSLIDKDLFGDYEDIDEFKRKLDRHYFGNKIYINIGQSVYKFDLHISSSDIKLNIYVRYEKMVREFRLGNDNLETGLKRYIENFRYKK